MINTSKKIHSIKVKYGFVFDWSIEDEMQIFKTIDQFEKWETRNPNYEIHDVKIRYKKKKKKITPVEIKFKYHHSLEYYLCASEYSLHSVYAFPNNASKKDIDAWLERENYIQVYRPCYENDYNYYGSAGGRCGYEVKRVKNKVYIFTQYDI